MLEDMLGKLCYIGHPSYRNLRREYLIPLSIIPEERDENGFLIRGRKFRLYRIEMQDYIDMETIWIDLEDGQE